MNVLVTLKSITQLNLCQVCNLFSVILQYFERHLRKNISGKKNIRSPKELSRPSLWFVLLSDLTF